MQTPARAGSLPARPCTDTCTCRVSAGTPHTCIRPSHTCTDTYLHVRGHGSHVRTLGQAARVHLHVRGHISRPCTGPRHTCTCTCRPAQQVKIFNPRPLQSWPPNTRKFHDGIKFLDQAKEKYIFTYKNKDTKIEEHLYPYIFYIYIFLMLKRALTLSTYEH